MWNKLPIIGWIITIIAAIGLSVPFWLAWSVFGIGERFFSDYLPSQFVDPGFWEIFWLFICLGIFRWVLSCITPRFVHVSVSNDNTFKEG
jgi:hypothetical protein